MYPVFYVRFLVRVVCVRESVKTWGKLKSKKFSRVAREKLSRKVKHMPRTWLECEELGQDGDSWFSRVSRG